MKGYVYRFIGSNGGILYVGKTNNIMRRMKEHFIDRNTLYEESYDKVARVEYLTFDSIVEASMMEQLLINKWQCPFNSRDKYRITKDKMFDKIEIPDKWKIYTANHVPGGKVFTLSPFRAILSNLIIVGMYLYILITLFKAYL